MRKQIFLLCFISWTILAMSQSTNMNFVQTHVLLVPVSDENAISTLNQNQRQITVDYFDGLARRVQRIQWAICPDKHDLIQPIEYDQYDREVFQFLPYEKDQDSKNYDPDYLGNQSDFYSDPPVGVAYSLYPFAEREFDNSPLNEIRKQGSPGYSWQLVQGHVIQFIHRSNNSSDSVRIWNSNGNDVSSNGFYNPSELYVLTTIDENGDSSNVFKDKLGNEILHESFLDGKKVRTYYLYDRFGLLRYVISPEGTRSLPDGNISSLNSIPDFVFNYCYSYQYDPRKRMIRKTIPGQEYVTYEYDNLDRLVFSQDGVQREQNHKIYFKYDSLSRMIEKGIYKTGDWFPLVYNFYDDYDFNNDGNADFYYIMDSDFPDNQQHMNNIGRFTGTSVSLDPFSSEKSTIFLRTAIIYDKFDRIIQTHKENFVFGRGWDIFTNGYDFPGRMTKTKQTHNIGEPSKSEPITILKLMEYDHGSRLTKLSQSINGKDLQEVSYQEYNSIGQLIKKSLNRTESNPSFQEIDYLYNIRGWLRLINPGGITSNNDLFFMDIFYNEQINEPGFNSQPAYNGNISAIRWLSRSFPEFKANLYSYDDLNRINQADYLKFNNGSWNSSTDYDVSDIKYDFNGNIQSMSTYGLNAEEKYEEIDDLTYYYSGNRLVGINDEIGLCSGYDFCDNGNIYDPNEPQTMEYHYDQNGNLIDDVNKGIVSIQYDPFNNMPVYLDLGEGRYIHFLYDASGVKWKKEVFEHGDLTETTDYVYGFVYTNNELNYIMADEGRILCNDDRYDYEYQLKDHLGNVRVCFTDVDGNPYITQENSYYPFGLQMKGLEFNADTPPNKYLYNGKEMQFDHCLDWYDYGARFYDPQLGRFHNVDAFAEKYSKLTPYHYAVNNPVLIIDINGDSVKYANDNIRQFVDQFTSKTYINDKGKEKKNNKYHEGFADLINKLDQSTDVFEFSESQNTNSDEDGSVTYDGNKFSISIGEPKKSFGGKSGLLFEETFHAGQILNGDVKVIKSDKSPTGWGFIGADASTEYYAKKFASTAPGVSFWFTNQQGFKAQTQLGLISSMNLNSGIHYLTKGTERNYGSYYVTYDPPYPNLNTNNKK